MPTDVPVPAVPVVTAAKSSTDKIYRTGSLVVYDAEWQFPAITEQHAFNQVARLPINAPGIVYFGFPWATLIDLLNRKKPDAARLKAILRKCVQLFKPGEKVVTVCQHILMQGYPELFVEAGISDVFWTHAVKGVRTFPDYPKIEIHPFPLYPVQAVGEVIDGSHERPLLFSFIGAKGTKRYLSQSRSFILDALKDDKRGFVASRTAWHYQKAVYDHQIEKNEIPVHELVDQQATQEFQQVLRDSIFSLCPSGTGPNSIRLWESLGLGAIPVILADTYLPPGDLALWEEAVVFYPETLEEIKALPDRLAAMAKDPILLARKRHAMKKLWMLYGPDDFIYDIRKFFLALQGERGSFIEPRVFSFEPLLTLARKIASNKELGGEELKVFILGCSTRAITAPDVFFANFQTNAVLREAVEYILTHCRDKHSQSLGALLATRGVVLN